jgi:ABC-2 type transport system permease protein
MLGTGAGLLLATVAVRIHDALDFTVVLLQLTAFVTPTFYLLGSVSEPMRSLIEANPLTQVLILFRDLVYGGRLSPWWTWAWAIVSGALAFAAGTFALARTWRTSAAML